MEAVSNVLNSSSLYTSYQSSGQNATAKALSGLNAALQSGSVANSQSALSSVQETMTDDSGMIPSPPFPTNAQASAAYAELVSSVQAGNLANAQVALSQLQLALKSLRGSSGGGDALGATGFSGSAGSTATDAAGTDNSNYPVNASPFTSADLFDSAGAMGQYVNVTV